MQGATPVTQIITEIADEKDVDVYNLQPLSTVIDADALNELLEHSTSEIEVTFEYEGYTVTVGNDGSVVLGR